METKSRPLLAQLAIAGVGSLFYVYGLLGIVALGAKDISKSMQEHVWVQGKGYVLKDSAAREKKEQEEKKYWDDFRNRGGFGYFTR